MRFAVAFTLAHADSLRAMDLARRAAGDPEAAGWLAEATKGLGPA